MRIGGEANWSFVVSTRAPIDEWRVRQIAAFEEQEIEHELVDLGRLGTKVLQQVEVRSAGVV
jgi:hypothetical protein